VGTGVKACDTDMQLILVAQPSMQQGRLTAPCPSASGHLEKPARPTVIAIHASINDWIYCDFKDGCLLAVPVIHLLRVNYTTASADVNWVAVGDSCTWLLHTATIAS
jgi:hypothetical protein